MAERLKTIKQKLLPTSIEFMDYESFIPKE